MTGRRLSRTVVALVAVTVVGVGGAIGASPAVSAGTVRPHTAAGTWTQLSSGTLNNIENIGLARFGSSLQLAWVSEDGGGNETLRTRIVGADGLPISAQIAAVSGWGTLNSFPAVFANGTQRVIAFSGIQNTNGTNPYSQGYEYYVTSPDGTTWTLSTGALSQQSTASGSEGTDALDAGGTPLVGYTDTLNDAVNYHSGFVGSIPTTPGTDPETSKDSCCSYNTGLGRDTSSGESWAIWYSNSGHTTTNGVLAQPIEPSLGTLFQAPGSNVHSNGANNSLTFQYRIATAARAGGGVYAAYLVGYPTATKVALWKLGSPTAMTHSASGSAQVVNAAAGPAGRLWLFWWDGATDTIDAVRTNPAANRFGAVCKITTPSKTEDVWNLVGNGEKGPLQLVALAGEPAPQVYDAVVKPCLSVSVSPATLSAAKGGSFTVTVSDAGAAIKGANVSFAGQHKSTNSSGKVSFSVARHHAAGRFPITITKQGYQAASASIRIH